MPSQVHEDLNRESVSEGSSDRNFGVWFALIGGILGLWPLRTGGPIRIWALVAGAVFLLAALIAPKVLHPLNAVWTSFGVLLGKIVNPIVTGIVFAISVIPIALIVRWTGKDLLRLKADPGASSYWIRRPQPGPTGESMQNQF